MFTNVLEYLEANRTLDKPAFIDELHAISYPELYEKARAIGTALARLHVRNQPFGVVIRRNIESLVLFLGVVYSGNFYVPLDNEMPRGRMDVMLSALSPAAVLGLEEDLSAFSACRTLSYEALAATEIDDGLLSDLRQEHLDIDPLYAIFTSGSTGVPKTVLISHRGVLDLAEQFSTCFDFSGNDRFGNQAPFDFDVSVKDIYLTLKHGATLTVIPKKLFSMPAALVDFLNQQEINVIIWAVSALRIVAQLKTFRSNRPQFLKTIMFSGEVMPPKVLNYWRDALPDACYVNLYGPTEITCNCTFYKVQRDFRDDEAIPIGRPFPNTRICLLDETGKEAAPGEVGEICVSGAGVALGYYKDPERTNQVFTADPLCPAYSRRLYHTGDLGRYNERGELMFLSRRDHQIKHMGHRIELGEIEAAVNSLPFIHACCCLYDRNRDRIVLCYQAGTACDKDIIAGLAQRLPKYMRPNRYCFMEALPMTSHGKLDRKRLAEEVLS